MVHVELAAYVTALLALYIAESPARGTVSRGRRIHYPCTYFWLFLADRAGFSI